MQGLLAKLLPTSLKQQIKTVIRDTVSAQPPYSPSHPGENAYCIKLRDQASAKAEGLPVPPEELWVGMAPDLESYLAGGRNDIAVMARILQENGSSIAHARRVLEFGCGAARMLRHLREFAPQAELWGVDISAQHIQWCVENLTPPLHFATTTVIPHLPFEDRSFDLIFCGSVFTHIEDVQESWLLELGRVLRPAGKLYITIHDEHTVRLLDNQRRDHWLAEAMGKQLEYVSNKDDFKMIVIGRGPSSQVFYHSSHFKAILPPGLRWLSLTPEAYGYQSAVLLEKPGAE